MLGSLFGAAARLINIPVQAVESVADIATGGDGSRQSKENVSPIVPSNIIDNVADRLERLDE